MYAIIRTGGKQYKVAPDAVIRVEKLPGAAGDEIEIGDVLMLDDDAEAQVGTPLVDGARVTATILEQRRGPKILVFRKKRRKNHRRLRGHRQDETILRVIGILPAGARPAKAKKAAPKPAKDEKPAAKKAAPKQAGKAGPKAKKAATPAAKKSAAKKADKADTAAGKAPAKKTAAKKPVAKKPAAKAATAKAAKKAAPKASAKPSTTAKKSAKKSPAKAKSSKSGSKGTS